MNPNLALRVISIPSFIICCTIFIFKDFYLQEILSDIDHETNKEIGFLINICAICGLNVSILLFNASTLVEQSARRMLKASGLIFANKQRFCLSVKYGCLSIINGDSSEKSQSFVN